MSRIAHIMTPTPMTMPATATAGEAAQSMVRLALRHLPVVDAGGRLIGMLSDRDLRGPMIGTKHTGTPVTTTTPIEQLMTRDVVTASPDDEVGTVARRIVEHRIGAVPIVDADGAPLGIVSYVDVLRRLAEEAEEDARAIDRMDG